MDQKILDYSANLKKLGIRHEIVEHPDLRTPKDVQAHLNLALADGLSTLIMKADSDFVAVIRRDDCRLNSSHLKKILQVKNLKMANPEEFAKITNMPLGAARVFNPGLKTVLDTKLFEKEYLTGGTGSFVCSFRYLSKDLKKIPNNIIADFTEKVEGKNFPKRVFAGIRATGRLHLGNYMGSIKGMIELVNSGEYDCIFQVVDMHTITTPYDKENLQKAIHEVVLDYLGAGLPIEKCHLTIQSLIPEHVLLSYYFATIYSVNKLEDLPTFKDKRAQHPEYVNLGLLYYPVLMAADVLLYKASEVPVGIDQEPHLEVMREIARKFNATFGETFPEPKRFATPGGYVPSLKGNGKMSKSVEGSYINLTDDELTIRKKIAGIVTDDGKNVGKYPEGEVKTIFNIIRLFSKEKEQKYQDDYKKGVIKFSEMKKDLGDLIIEELKPIQERRKKFENDPKLVAAIIEEGRNYCARIAENTLREVKTKMGMI